jgi:hypothetical protein
MSLRMTAGGLVPISKREPWYTLVLLLLPPAPSYKGETKRELKGLSHEID